MAQRVIKIPGELADELDRLAGYKRRTSYAIDVLWAEVRRRKQRQALQLSAGAWKNHPELAEGGAAYIERVRSEEDERFESAMSTRDR